MKERHHFVHQPGFARQGRSEHFRMMFAIKVHLLYTQFLPSVIYNLKIFTSSRKRNYSCFWDSFGKIEKSVRFSFSSYGSSTLCVPEFWQLISITWGTSKTSLGPTPEILSPLPWNGAWASIGLRFPVMPVHSRDWGPQVRHLHGPLSWDFFLTYLSWDRFLQSYSQ